MPLEKFVKSGRYKNRDAAKKAYRAYLAKKHDSEHKKMKKKHEKKHG